MIFRARPKYLTLEDIKHSYHSKNNFQHDEEELFFNHGRSGLAFFLSNYKEYIGRKPTVLLQSFNCSSVMEVALGLELEVVLADIKLLDFSLSLEELRNVQTNLDIVIMTHYQGIVNQEYSEIVSFCQSKKILLIEDSAQTMYSSIDSHIAGSLGDIVMNSFAFDKPTTSMFGGSLIITNLKDEKLRSYLIKKYKTIPNEKHTKAKNDIRTLYYIFKKSLHKSDTNLANYKSINLLLSLSLGRNIEKFMINNKPIFFLFSLVNKLYGKLISYQIKISKLDSTKINLIKKQRRRFKKTNFESEALLRFLDSNDFIKPNYKDSNIVWNRFSMIETSGRLKRTMINMGVEASNFNWPTPLHKRYNNYVPSKLNSYPNTDLASKYIVNIPVWSTIFQDLVE